MDLPGNGVPGAPKTESVSFSRSTDTLSAPAELAAIAVHASSLLKLHVALTERTGGGAGGAGGGVETAGAGAGGSAFSHAPRGKVAPAIKSKLRIPKRIETLRHMFETEAYMPSR